MSKEFNTLIDQIQSQNCYQQAIRVGSQKYHLKPYMISDLYPNLVRILYEKILKKFYPTNQSQRSHFWFENELRIFIWVIVCYLFIKSLNLQNMKDSDWQFIAKVFPEKDSELFIYQCRALNKIQLNIKNHPWDFQQIQTLKIIVQTKSNKIKWNQVSKQLYFKSNKQYYRSPKQCRERWLNHDDPQKKKGYWTAQQCLNMFKYVLQNGKKWAGLVKTMQNARNQHSIKNKFNSLFRKQKKLLRISKTDEQIYQLIIQRINKFIQVNSQSASFIIGEQKGKMKNRFNRQINPQSIYNMKFMPKILAFNKKKKNQKQQLVQGKQTQNIDIIEKQQSVKLRIIQQFQQQCSQLFEYSEDYQNENQFLNDFYIKE